MARIHRKDLQDVTQRKRNLRVLNLAAFLATGEEDVRCGRTMPAAVGFMELRRQRKRSH